jgi:hypothetical protein
MSEIMTVESIIDAYWQTQNYFTKPRFFYATTNNGNSDIDVLAYDAINNSVVFAESKAHGGKSKLKHGEISEKTYEQVKAGENSYANKKTVDDFLKFITDVKYLIGQDNDVNFPFDFTNIKKLTLHFVTTTEYLKNMETIKNIESELKAYINKKHKLPKIKIEIIIETHFDVLVKIIKALNSETRGKRYGHPVLDILREFNRYLRLGSMSSKINQELISTYRKSFLDLMEN